MNNLVSKNPVQKFKQGRRIVKAQFSWGQGFGIKNTGNIFGPKVNVGYEIPTIDNDFSLDTSAKYLGYNPSGTIGNMLYNFPEDQPSQTTKKEPVVEEKSDTTIKGKSGTTTKGKSRKTSVTPSIFAGHRIGRTGGLNYSINDADKQQLIGTGQFSESDFTNARATQQALNRYFANSGFGSVKEDNYWGDQSRAALALALSKSKGLTPFNNETTIVKTPIISTYTPTTPIDQKVSNLKLNINVPQQTYDRTRIREFIRNKGINPYSFSGAQRRALRMVMNGQGTDNDKLLVKGMNIFKQGGQLISKDPIKRFKQRNFRLVVQ